MKPKDDNSPPAAQISQWRRLWTILLAPHPPRDEKPSGVKKTEAAESNDQERPQSQTNNTARGDER